MLLCAAGVYAAPSVMDEYNHAWQLVGQRKSDEAIPLLESIIEKDPSFYRAYKSVVDAYRQKKGLDQAERYFRGLAMRNPRNAYAHYGLAIIHGERFRLGPQVEEYSKCVTIAPQAVVCYVPLVNSLRQRFKEFPTLKHLRSRTTFGPEHPYACIAFAELYFRRREITMALKTAKSCLVKAMDRDDLELLVAAHRALGDAYEGASDFDNELVHTQEELKLMERLDDWEGQLLAMSKVASAWASKGDTRQQLEITGRRLEIVRRLGHAEWLHYTLFTMGQIRLHLGELEEGLRYLWEAHRGIVEDEDPYQVNILEKIAAVYHSKGDFVEARRLYEATRSGAVQFKNRGMEAFALRDLGVLCQDTGDFIGALHYGSESVKLFQELGLHHQAGAGIGNIGTVHALLGNWPTALRLTRQSYDSGLKLHDRIEELRNLLVFGDLYLRMDDPTRARKYLTSALNLTGTIKNNSFKISALLGLGAVHLRQGRISSAVEKLHLALDLARQVKAVAEEVDALNQLGECYLRMNELDRAEEHYSKSLAIVEHAKFIELIVAARRGMAVK